MEYRKITNLLGNILDMVPKFITKKQIEVHDQSGNANDRYKPRKQARLTTSMLQSNLQISVIHILLQKELLVL